MVVFVNHNNSTVVQYILLKVQREKYNNCGDEQTSLYGIITWDRVLPVTQDLW